jgi:nucleotide-binding universal stress UspA family protein
LLVARKPDHGCEDHPACEGDLNLADIKTIGGVLDTDPGKAVAEIKNSAEAEGALVKSRLEQGDVPEKTVEVADDDEQCDLINMGAKKKKNVLTRLFGVHAVKKVIDDATLRRQRLLWGF